MSEFSNRFSPGWRHRLSVDVHGCLDVGMAEKLLLHGQIGPHAVKESGERMPEGVPPNLTGLRPFGRRSDVIGKKDTFPARTT